MPNIDPVDSALDALAAYFGALSTIGVGRRGWPEHPTALDMTAGPVASLTYIGHETQERTPGLVDQVDDVSGIVTTATWRVADVLMTAQLDLWAPYRATRSAAAHQVEGAFHNRIPWKGGLELLSTGYHDRPLTVFAGLGANVDDDSGTSEAMWRKTWDLQIRSDLVVVAANPLQAIIDFRLTTELGPDMVTEPAHQVT